MALPLRAAPLPPFPAVVARASIVHRRPQARAPDVGLLRAGAVVSVTSCVPDCSARNAWALLGADGAVQVSHLRSQSEPPPPTVPLFAEQLWYGRVNRLRRRIFSRPDVRSRVIDRRPIPQEMAFLPDAPLRARGWVERVEGGYVRTRQVVFFKVTQFAGEAHPTLPLTLTRRPSGATTPGRATVRVIRFWKRPAGIPAGARWVRIDLRGQTLTAYEGDHPVYATLISSGKAATRTHPGLYKVEHKMIYSDMHGEANDPYIVDRVPYVLYFHKNEALHGTYWHDRFGAPASHGCVNLSLVDARWLFEWAPPTLPANWSSVDPMAAGLETLWVSVRT
jgi:hypothetical protein